MVLYNKQSSSNEREREREKELERGEDCLIGFKQGSFLGGGSPHSLLDLTSLST